MAIAVAPQSSLRLERAESSRLAWALAISLALHALVFGSFELGKKLGWWRNIHWPAWLQSAKMLTEVLKKKEPPPPQQPREVPLMFVDVSPAQAAPEPPKKTEFYSDKNSQAANPDPVKEDTQIPKITGEQTKIVKTEDVPRSQAFPLQPTPPVDPPKEVKEEAKPDKEVVTEAKPKPTVTPG